MIKRTITHEIGHGIGLYHPFADIAFGGVRQEIHENRYERVRYHDRVTYLDDTDDCHYEDSDRTDDTPGNHNVDRCGVSPHRTWDSGTTVMDYGDENLTYEIYMNINGLEREDAWYLVDFVKSTQFLSPLHDQEFLFVMPKVHEAHEAKDLPIGENGETQLRKPKPQWSPSTDSTNQNQDNDDTLDQDNDDISDQDNDDNDDTNTENTNTENTNTENTETVTPPPPPLNPPSVPLNLSADDDNASVELKWVAPSNNGGAGITGYQYRYRESGSGNWLISWSNIVFK